MKNICKDYISGSEKITYHDFNLREYGKCICGESKIYTPIQYLHDKDCQRDQWISKALYPIGIDLESREGRMLAVQFGVLMDRLDEEQRRYDFLDLTLKAYIDMFDKCIDALKLSKKKDNTEKTICQKCGETTRTDIIENGRLKCRQ